MNSKLLEVLRCPESKLSLQLLSMDKLVQLNQDILAGKVQNRSGKQVSVQMTEALISSDGKYVYPIIDGIPVLLIDESIVLTSI